MKIHYYACIIGSLFIVFAGVPAVHAQSLDPTLWQAQATGLKTTINAQKKTSGLVFGIDASSAWPAITVQGGVYDSHGSLQNLRTMRLGEIKLPNETGGFSTETANWSKNELTFGSNALKLTVSRASPGVLVQTTRTALRLFSGNINGYTVANQSVSPKNGIVAPKYIAYSIGGVVTVKQLSGTLSIPSAIDNNWILVWWGTNSVYADTKKPLSYANDDWSMATLPLSYAYTSDIPILLKFSSVPSTIALSSEGGIDVSFAQSIGSMVVFPLFGRDHPDIASTEQWVSSFPTSVKSRIDFWVSRLCNYPANVTEQYAYTPSSDSVNITSTFSFTSVCANGTPFAILPPVVGIAKDIVSLISIPGGVKDGQMPTEFGPIIGVDNATTISYQVKNLKKYYDAKRVVANPSTISSADAPLHVQVQQIISGGHLQPWFFSDNMPRGDTRGDIYFLNPGDTLSYLSALMPVLSSADQQQLTQFLKTERATYKPETLANLPDAGSFRQPYSIQDAGVYARWQQVRPELFQSSVKLFNYYGLAAYYKATGETIPGPIFDPANSTGTAISILSNDLNNIDWATHYPFEQSSPAPYSVSGVNNMLAGMSGIAYLTKNTTNQTVRDVVHGALAKSIVLRLALARYPRYQVERGLVEYPASSRWLMDQTKSKWTGFIFTYSWTSAMDDPRQVIRLNQFGTLLADTTWYLYGIPADWSDWTSHMTSAHLPALSNATPELMRLLADTVKADAAVFLKKTEMLIPHWYAAYGEGVFGSEHNLLHPGDVYQLFSAKVFLELASKDQIKTFVDVPWLENGDYFYMDKLKELSFAEKGWCWSDDQACLGLPTNTPGPQSTPTPNCLPGDINCSGKVDNADLLILLGNFGKSGVGDINNSGKVDSADLLILLGNFGK